VNGSGSWPLGEAFPEHQKWPAELVNAEDGGVVDCRWSVTVGEMESQWVSSRNMTIPASLAEQNGVSRGIRTEVPHALCEDQTKLSRAKTFPLPDSPETPISASPRVKT
jgi:hypothetical protein